jgi:hypothetical protein
VRPTSTPPAETWYITSNANARECPQTTCSVVTGLVRGQRVQVIGQEDGQSVQGSTVWRRIRYQGQDVYVHSSLTSSTPPPTSAPAPRPQPTSQAPSVAQPTEPMSIAPTPIPPPSFTCNCSKTCPQMASCEEAYFQLQQCGCSRRDGDNDGVPCEDICPGG